MTVSQQERRRFKRVTVSCPVTVFSRGGEELATGKTVDLSDGGAFVAIPMEKIETVDGPLNVAFALPRTTPNSQMIEDVACHATVLRRQPMRSDDHAGLALRFTRPLDLALEA